MKTQFVYVLRNLHHWLIHWLPLTEKVGELLAVLCCLCLMGLHIDEEKDAQLEEIVAEVHVRKLM